MMKILYAYDGIALTEDVIFTNIDDYKKATAPSEDVEQAHLMKWCLFMESTFPELDCIFHIPNEGKRTAAAGGRLKQIGMRAGVPDICLPVKRGQYSSLFIELKKIGGKPTKEQIDWLEKLERQGSCVAVCEGAETAEEVIKAYLTEDNATLEKKCLYSANGDFDKLRKPKKKG